MLYLEGKPRTLNFIGADQKEMRLWGRECAQLENEEEASYSKTKYPQLENEVPKSKTNHLQLENEEEASYSKTKHPQLENDDSS